MIPRLLVTILASDLSLGLEWTLNVMHYFSLKLKLEKKIQTSSIFVVLETLLEFIYRQVFQQTQRVLCVFEPANENCKGSSHE